VLVSAEQLLTRREQLAGFVFFEGPTLKAQAHGVDCENTSLAPIAKGGAFDMYHHKPGGKHGENQTEKNEPP
jgi:hypothetical protein